MATSGEFYVGPSNEPDKYRLIHQVGSGGEAQLWRAELHVSGTWEPVAVKLLRPDRLADLDRWKARWAEQAEVLRFIRHPGVVGVREHFEGGPMHYAGETPQGPASLYLVMNWVEGVPLRDWVPFHRESDSYFESLRYLAQVGDVLDWLHSGQATPSARPVIHADVTPANVLITPTGQAVLVDFGLIRLAAGSSAFVEGTRGYMAPEVIANAAYSPASDRYSFGALTYFVLTGQNPPVDPNTIFQGFSTVPTVRSQPGLAEHLMLMFHPNPAERPSAGDWVRFFRVSGSTSMGAPLGLQPTTPLGVPAVLEEPSPAPADDRKGNRRLIAVIVVLLALIAGGVAFAVTRSTGNKTAGQRTQGITRHNQPPVTATSDTTTTITTPPDTSTSTSTLTTSPTGGPPGVPFFLSDANTTGGTGSPNQNAVTINGTTYPHSIYDNYSECGDSTSTKSYEYDLGRHYGTFTATIGQDDSSPLNVPIHWDVYGDSNKHLYTGTMVQGQSFPLSVSVAGVLTLTVTTTFTPLTNGSNQTCGTVKAAWGEATVSP